MRVRTRADRGQTVPLMVMVLLAVGALLLIITRLGGAIDDAARARTAADAAALAGAADGRDAAVTFATANGGELISYVAEGSDVEVGVRVGQTVAIARARRTVRWGPSP